MTKGALCGRYSKDFVEMDKIAMLLDEKNRFE